tara:strand:- start:630 stop:1286 length:657 start_codon:yes stop_codon:yes gene_type:complete
MNKLICIIPALEKNNYSPLGDLIEWGGTTLLEWKISQVLKLREVDQIIVTTPSTKIKKILYKYNVQVLMRKKGLSLGNLYKLVGKKFSNKKILWLNPTAPFLSDRNLKEFIEKYKKVSKKYDSAFTCVEIREFLFNKKGSINFNSLSKAVSRKKLPPIYLSTNGAYIIPGSHLKKNGSLYGANPYKFKVSWLQSLEVKSSSELESFKFFMSKYIKENI